MRTENRFCLTFLEQFWPACSWYLCAIRYICQLFYCNHLPFYSTTSTLFSCNIVYSIFIIIAAFVFYLFSYFSIPSSLISSSITISNVKIKSSVRNLSFCCLEFLFLKQVSINFIFLWRDLWNGLWQRLPHSRKTHGESQIEGFTEDSRAENVSATD